MSEYPTPPEKVREGDTLSSRWMNKVVDCLKAVPETATKTANSSSSQIGVKPLMRNNKYREPEARPLPFYHKGDFELRIKPVQFCNVDGETGNWDKILQVREGHIIDYHGTYQKVPMAEGSGSGSGSEEQGGSASSGSSDGGSATDDEVIECDADWHDIGVISSTTSAPIEVFVVIKQDSKGAVTEAYFSTIEEEYIPWGFESREEAERYMQAAKQAQESGTEIDSSVDDGSGVVSVRIGSAHSEAVEQGDYTERHFYIEQNHSGPIELQVVEVQPFAPIMAFTEGSGGSAGGSGGGIPEAICLFLQRDVNLFIFKGLLPGEGILMSDGEIITVALDYANDGMTAQSDPTPLATGDQTLGGVNFIKYNSINAAPHIRHGVIDIPTADTVDRHATGVINGVEVTYIEEGESANNYIEDGKIHIEIIKFKGDEGSEPPHEGTGAGSEAGSIPGGGGSVPHGSGSAGGSVSGCDCAAKWQALEAWKASIEARLSALESAIQGGCNCNCECHADGLMAEIQEAIDNAVAGVQVQASLSQLLETTQTGELQLDGQVNANSRGGTSSVDAHY